MSYVKEIATLRGEIDRIDVEIVEKLSDWVQAHYGTPGTDGEPFMAQLQGLALEHDLEIGGLKRIFQAMKTLTEKGRTG